MKSPRFLVVPAAEKGRGGGHLARSAFLTRSLRAAGREAFLFAPEGALKIPGENPDPSWVLPSDPRQGGAGGMGWDFIVLDRPQTSAEEAASWSALAPLIGIDEGGPCRNSFEFLVDLLPAPRKRRSDPPNTGDPSLLPLPLNRRPSFQNAGRPPRILVSFGA